MFTVTTDEIPGYRITHVFGQVLGTIVRTITPGQGFSAGMQALGGGEIPQYTKLLWENRQEAMNRMWADAVQRGANAVVGTRFDSTEFGEISEMCAYGTAVVIEPLAS